MSQKSRVFVIEDDEAIRDAVKEFLEMSGYLVDTAVNGAIALELLGASEDLPSLLLLDLNMPVMSGKAFLEKLRVQSAEHARIPVLLMSALPDVNVPGVAGVLSKPFRLRSLLDQIRSLELS